MWVNGIWIEHIKKPRRSKHLAYVARDYIEDADFEEITERRMNNEIARVDTIQNNKHAGPTQLTLF